MMKFCIYIFTFSFACIPADSLQVKEAAKILNLTTPIEIVDARMENDCGTSNACGILIRDKKGFELKYALAPRIRGRGISEGDKKQKGVIGIISEYQNVKMDTNDFLSEIKGRKPKEIPDEYYQMDTRKSYLGAIYYKDDNAREIGLNSKEEVAIYTLIWTYVKTRWPEKTTEILDREIIDFCNNTDHDGNCQPEKEWIIARTSLNILELLSIRLEPEEVKRPPEE